MKDNSLTFDAKVVGIEKSHYALEIEGVKAFEGVQIRGFLSGKMRMNKIKVIVGDVVTVELDEYDTTKGRITYRKK